MTEAPYTRLDRRLQMAGLESVLFGKRSQLRISRFEIGRKLGAGGMGVVHEAYDPQLARRVAVKVLKHHSEHSGSPQRLVREAKAMAAISHPNVLTVYETGLYEGHPYIVMEFVDGGTLEEWQAEAHSIDEVLRLYVGAARGLNAAHSAGLVHRDFKPANVFVGRDGRPRVADFGLVGFGTSGIESPLSTGPDPQHDHSGSGRMTKTGALVGTPAYMSPEQYEGSPATLASDQFSFCVALFEALYGEPPFAGRTVEERSEAVRRGAVRVPSTRSVPERVRRALLIGLSVDPRDRHPSMHSLISRLERGSTRWPWLLGGMTACGLLFVATAADPPECDARSRVARVWNASVRESIRERLGTEGAWPRIEGELEAYVGRWADAYRGTCGAAEGAALDAAMWCLDQRLDSASTVVTVLQDATSDEADSLSTDRLLPAIEDCSDTEYLRTRGRRSSNHELDDATAEARAELVRLETLYQLGRFEEAIRAGVDLEWQVEQLTDALLLADVSMLLGLAYERNQDFANAEAALTRAYTTARAAAADDIAVAAATRLIYVYATGSRSLVRAQEWAQHALSLNVEDPERLYDLRNGRAMLELKRRHVKEALELYQQNHRVYADVHADDTEGLGTLHSNIGVALMDLGQLDEALEHLTEATALHEQNLGPEHPELAIALSNMALVHERQGRYAESMELLERALEVRRKAFGEQHRRVADVLLSMAAVARKLGRGERAVELATEAVAMVEANVAPDDPMLASALTELASAYLVQNRPGAARPLLERALVVQTEALGPNARNRGFTLHTLAGVLRRLGDYEEAEARQLEALDIAERADGERSSAASSCHGGLAQIYAQWGRIDQAVAHRRREISILEELDAGWLGASLNALGDTLRAAGRNEEALELYRRAVKRHTQRRSATHPYVAYSLHRVGLALDGLGRLDDAAEAFQRAMAMRETPQGRRFLAELAESRLALARVERARGHLPRAKELAAAAIVDYGDDPKLAAAREEAERFTASLRSHGPSMR